MVVSYTVSTPASVGGILASQNYTEGVTGQLLIASAASLTDNDSANFNGGYLKVAISSGKVSDEDKLYIQEINNITLVNDQYFVNGTVYETIKVYHTGTLIGTISAANNGFRGNPLQIDLNSSATPAVTRDLLRSIYYQNIDTENALAGTRGLTIDVNDGTGGVSTSTTSIVVSAQTFSITSASAGWTRLLNGAGFDPSEDQQAT